jgi:hypothetical protein
LTLLANDLDGAVRHELHDDRVMTEITLLVGLLEIFVAVFISSVYKDAICFSLLIFLLIVFPQGIFGERVAEKA